MNLLTSIECKVLKLSLTRTSGIPLLDMKRLKPFIKDGTCMSGVNSRCMTQLLAQVNNKTYFQDSIVFRCSYI